MPAVAWCACGPAGVSSARHRQDTAGESSATRRDVRGHRARPGPPPEPDDLLERDYRIKLHSLQFCGPPNFVDGVGRARIAGADVSDDPVAARAFADLGPVGAVEKAILLVDDHFGGNPLLGFRHNRFFVRNVGK